MKKTKNSEALSLSYRKMNLTLKKKVEELGGGGEAKVRIGLRHVKFEMPYKT